MTQPTKEQWMRQFKTYGPWAPVACDAIIANREGIVLIQRKNEPYKGCWCLPGGFHDMGETLEQTVVREALEETRLIVKIVELIGVSSDPNRDPRGQLISCYFWCNPIDDPRSCKGGDDASNAVFFRWGEFNRFKDDLGFDHSMMVEKFKVILARNREILK